MGECDYEVAPTGVGSDACVDACCRVHDSCCDTDTRGGCNAGMLACISNCSSDAAACWYGVVPLPAWVYTRVFQAVESWCCDAPC